MNDCNPGLQMLLTPFEWHRAESFVVKEQHREPPQHTLNCTLLYTHPGHLDVAWIPPHMLPGSFELRGRFKECPRRGKWRCVAGQQGDWHLGCRRRSRPVGLLASQRALAKAPRA